MSAVQRLDAYEVPVGGLRRAELLEALEVSGVAMNQYARTLLAGTVFDGVVQSRIVAVTERSVAELGFDRGATLPQIFGAASTHGLRLCPGDTGPYLRLALTEQTASADSRLSIGRSPDHALTVATVPPSDDVEQPKGFYLRKVEGRLWLRGYRCDDAHLFDPADRFVFELADRPDQTGASSAAIAIRIGSAASVVTTAESRATVSPTS